MKFLDLFSGIGGFRKGLELNGHECVGYVEKDKFARKSYQAMYNTENEWTKEDITTVTNEEFAELKGSVDIITGGFPCQSFSLAGKRLGFSDETRGTLFFDIIRAAKEIEPKILFLENVKGLVNHDSGNTFRVMIGALEELGYIVDYKVFNSKYFDVPQNRERIFIVATKNYTKDWYLKDIVSEHTEVNKRIIDILEDTVEDKFYLKKERVQSILDNLHIPIVPTTLEDEPKIENPLKNQTEFGWHFEQAVYNEKGLTRTLKAGGGSGNIPKLIKLNTSVSDVEETQTNVNHVAYLDDKEYIIRKFTPLETWRLQGYTDEQFLKAKEVNSNSQLYKQAGNSVTVKVIQKIAEKF